MYNYSQSLEERKERIKRNHINDLSSDNLKYYFTTKANFKNSLESLSNLTVHKNYLDFYLDYVFRCKLTPGEPKEIMDNNGISYSVTESLNMTLQDRQQYIFCIYHIGAYRTFIGQLVKNNYPFILLVDSNVYHRQKNRIRKSFERTCSYYGSRSELLLYNAEDESEFFKVYKKLKKGYSAIIFLDGNTGSGGVYQRNIKSQLSLKFFSKELISRTGIAKLKFATGVDVLPIVCKREFVDRTNYRIRIMADLSPTSVDVGGTTRYLYKVLEKSISSDILEWEGWSYVHKYYKHEAYSPLDIDNMNYDELGYFRKGNSNYLMNLRNYYCYEVSNTTYKKVRTNLLESKIHDQLF